MTGSSRSTSELLKRETLDEADAYAAAGMDADLRTLARISIAAASLDPADQLRSDATPEPATDARP